MNEPGGDPPAAGTAPVGFEIVPASSCSPGEIVVALAEAFGRDDFTDAWFRWKHQRCPFGASQGWVARDDQGIVGVRLFTPWRWATRLGVLDGLRPLDGGVVPRARRRGVFETLVRQEMDLRTEAGAPILLLSTSVPASRAAYLKLGWCPLGEVAHEVRPVAPRPARLAGWEPAPSGPEADPDRSPIRTAWTAEGLSWRFDPAAGHHYHSHQLVNAGGTNGVCYRVVSRRGIRTVVVEHLVGSHRDARRLLSAVAASVRAVAVLDVGGPGSGQVRPRRWRRAVGTSTLTSWNVATAADLAVDDVSSWGLALADLEGVL